MTKSKPSILIVDDEPQIRSVISDLLCDEYTPLEAENGAEALAVARQHRPSIILMDISMPELNGIEACERLRQDPKTKHIPVIMLTAVGQRENRIRCFSSGADDFIVKPFDAEELLSRIGSKIRRVQEAAPSLLYRMGNLRVESDPQIVWVGENSVQLTKVEAGILALLLKKPGEIVTRARIMDVVWRGQDLEDRVIDAHVTSLRTKLADFNGAIRSVYGKGYLLVTEQMPPTTKGKI